LGKGAPDLDHESQSGKQFYNTALGSARRSPLPLRRCTSTIPHPTLPSRRVAPRSQHGASPAAPFSWSCQDSVVERNSHFEKLEELHDRVGKCRETPQLTVTASTRPEEVIKVFQDLEEALLTEAGRAVEGRRCSLTCSFVRLRDSSIDITRTPHGVSISEVFVSRVGHSYVLACYGLGYHLGTVRGVRERGVELRG
jgi:hypothetical protein